FDLVELDAASNRGIDEIRNLREKAAFAAAGGVDARKVYLVDEVHMLTEPAFNALLKTLEEPPPPVIFVLATTEAHKVPATVVSRCQRFDFRRIPLAAVVDRLAYIGGEEGIAAEREALEAIARAATGSLRDAINLLEQLVDSYGRALTLDQVREGLGLVVDPRSGELAASTLRGDLAGGLALISSVRDDGLDLRQFQRQVVAQLRGLLLAKAGTGPGDSWSEEQFAEMRALVAGVPAERIVATLRAFGEADLRADPLSPLPLELALATSVLEEAQAIAPARAPVPQPAPRAPAPAARAPAPRANPPPPPVATPPTPEPRANNANDKPAPKVEPLGDGSPLLDEARARWPDIYRKARAESNTVGALLNSGCGIIQASEREVVFGFQHEIHLNKIQSDGGEHLRALQKVVDEVLGEGKTVRCVQDAEVQVQRPPRGGHLVRAAEELAADDA
ncbi:MAG: hypothetical protein HY723_00265, partial [Chloroflexi bacterium]|nr:hypothetical protein [Chloroflexota bacterium]